MIRCNVASRVGTGLLLAPKTFGKIGTIQRDLSEFKTVKTNKGKYLEVHHHYHLV